jgi:hypothetical protein
MFRFTIRDVLWLTVIAALSVAWWLEHSTRSRLSDELKSRNEELAVLRSGPDFFFHEETARLENELKKREPLFRFPEPLPPKRPFSVQPYHDPWQQAMLARQKLEKDADAAGYLITAGKDGRPTLEPKPGYWKERPSPPGEL